MRSDYNTLIETGDVDVTDLIVGSRFDLKNVICGSRFDLKTVICNYTPRSRKTFEKNGKINVHPNRGFYMCAPNYCGFNYLSRVDLFVLMCANSYSY